MRGDGISVKKEDCLLIIQLLYAMQEAVEKLEKYYGKKNAEKFANAKKEVLSIQRELNNLL